MGDIASNWTAQNPTAQPAESVGQVIPASELPDPNVQAAAGISQAQWAESGDVYVQGGPDGFYDLAEGAASIPDEQSPSIE